MRVQCVCGAAMWRRCIDADYKSTGGGQASCAAHLFDRLLRAGLLAGGGLIENMRVGLMQSTSRPL